MQGLRALGGKLGSVLLGMALLSACSMDVVDAPPLSKSLAGSQWQLHSMEGQTLSAVNPPDIQFDSERVSGFSGCNRYFGNYTGSNDGVFSVGAIGATKMACMGERDQVEQRYLRLLQQAKIYAVTRDRLHLLDARRNPLLVFTAVKPTAQTPK